MLFAPRVRFRVFGWVCVAGGRLVGNSCSLGLRCVFLVWVPHCFFFLFLFLSFFSPRFLESDCAIAYLT